MKLNQYLQPVDAPISTREQTSGYAFDADTERGAIRTMHVQNLAIGSAQIAEGAIGSAQVGTLSFNQISGGTATLGGTTNGNGLLTVKDAAGSEVVRLDNGGITISQGTITGVSVTTSVIQSGTMNNAVLGTPAVTGGTISTAVGNNMTLGTPTITGGTYTGTLSAPRIIGTTVFDVNAGSAALGTTGAFAIQTHSGSAILVVRSGANSFYFTCAGTL